MIDLTLYTRAGCHLCDEMKDAVERASRGISTRFATIDVDSRADLAATFGKEVPVLVVDGTKFAKFRLDPRKLRERLLRDGPRSRPAGEFA